MMNKKLLCPSTLGRRESKMHCRNIFCAVMMVLALMLIHNSSASSATEETRTQLIQNRQTKDNTRDDGAVLIGHVKILSVLLGKTTKNNPRSVTATRLSEKDAVSLLKASKGDAFGTKLGKIVVATLENGSSVAVQLKWKGEENGHLYVAWAKTTQADLKLDVPGVLIDLDHEFSATGLNGRYLIKSGAGTFCTGCIAAPYSACVACPPPEVVEEEYGIGPDDYRSLADFPTEEKLPVW